MRTKLLLLAPFFAALISGAQERQVGLVTSSKLDNGLSISVNTYCDPIGAGKNPFSCLGQSGLEAGIRPDLHSYIAVARSTRSWFGFSFTAEKISNGDSIQVSIGPASPSAGPAGFSQVPLPKYDPGPFTLAPGDILRIPLLVNPNTKETLIADLFSSHPVSHLKFVGLSTNTGEPRDFALQDVQMRLVQFNLFVNGKKVEKVGGTGEGRVFWYTLEGIGSGVLAFGPQAEPGFRKVGIIQGGTLRYQIGPDIYEWQCIEPILSGGGAYNLYVYWEPAAMKGGAFGWALTAEGALQGIAMFKAN